MNYLIVIPRFVDKVGEWYFFPLGIPYVSASMKANGLEPVTLNLNNEHGLVEDILRKFICDNNIDVVLTGGLSVQYNSIKEVIHFSKTINPKIITIVGGGIITSRPEVGMEALGEVDYGIIGEGEITTFYASAGYCHCNFTVMPNADEKMCEDFTNMMLSQDPNNPIIKKMMIMEGLNKWVKVTNKELEGYEVLAKAMKDQNLLENSI